MNNCGVPAALWSTHVDDYSAPVFVQKMAPEVIAPAKALNDYLKNNNFLLMDLESNIGYEMQRIQEV